MVSPVDQRSSSIETVDLNSWRVFHQMSDRGICVDITKAKALRESVMAQVEENYAIAQFYSGGETSLNLDSTQQLSNWMVAHNFNGKRTSTGQLATDEKSLLKYDHPIIEPLLAYRGGKKTLNTFLDPLIEKAEQNFDVIHPKWKLTRVRSGRVAMEDPNLLAYPSRTPEGKLVRGVFVPRAGMRLISVDYSQLEPRIIAALSGDPALLKIYAENRDLYSEVAAVLGVERFIAKIVTLGTAYGMGAHKLCEQLMAEGVTEYDVDGCQGLLDAWYRNYAKVLELKHRVLRGARINNGFARTTMGRTRFLPGLFATGGWPASRIREEAERQCFNHLIQGTAAEEVKMAMVRVAQIPNFHPLLQIHDEIVGEAPEATAESIKDQVIAAMAVDFGMVRLTASGKTGDNWGELK